MYLTWGIVQREMSILERIRKSDITNSVFIICVFVSLFIYMFTAHPFILSDIDDWSCASYWRRPLPIFGGFDSMRVYAEVIFPSVSMIGAYLVYPISHNYLMSLAFVYALVGAGLITAYTLFLSGLLRSLSKCSRMTANLVSLCFLMLHFLMYKNNWTNNIHLLWSKSPANFFMYTESVLICASLVMFFSKVETIEGVSISRRIWDGEYGYTKGGLLLLIVYLAVFSNSFSNIVLATYAGVHGLRELLSDFKFAMNYKTPLDKKSIWKNWFIRNWLMILILVMWVASLVFQLSDSRNGIARQQQGLRGSFSGAVAGYIDSFTSINKMAALIMVLSIVVFAATSVVDRRAGRRRSGLDKLGAVSFELVLAGILTSLYVIILSGVASPHYIYRPDVRVGYYFYLLAVIAILFAWAISGEKSESKLALALPFFSFVIVMQTLNYCKSYADPNDDRLPKETEIRMSQDIIDQFIEADEAELSDFELHVAENPNASDNWPYPHYSGEMIGDTLYRHGIISRWIRPKTVIDPEKNKELSITF